MNKRPDLSKCVYFQIPIVFTVRPFVARQRILKIFYRISVSY